MTTFEAEIKDHIGVYDFAIPDPICDAMVEDFKKNSKYQRLFSRHLMTEEGQRPGNLVADHAAEPYNDVSDRWIYTEMCPAIEFSEKLWKCYNHYSEAHNLFKSYQDETHLNAIKLQRTGPGEGYHIWHCEQGSRQSAHKHAFYIAYLNDIEDGGETEFLFQSRRVQPVKGRVVIAPACFTHLHRGNPPLKEEKYVATGWFEW
jgi:hypothetical protein